MTTATRVAREDGRPKRTKGERTAARILDAAEAAFAERGYEAASLREIARRAGLQQPGLYNYFASKRDLYAAVLERALEPMAAAMEARMREGRPRQLLGTLPGIMTDLLLEHPQMAALFQQALQDRSSPGQEVMRGWLDRLLTQGVDAARKSAAGPLDREDLAIQVVAMFNLTAGYFLSQGAFDLLGVGRLDDPANVARQKALLKRIGPALNRR